MLVGKRCYNHAVDVWGLGVVVYELLTGLPPFFSRNKERLYQKIVHCDVKFKDSQSTSAEARDFVLQLLQKDPSKRLGVVPVRGVAWRGGASSDGGWLAP